MSTTGKAVGVGFNHFFRAASTLNTDGYHASENFKHNAFILGPLVFAGMVADYAAHYSPWGRA